MYRYGDIILAEYSDLDCQIRTGVFVVIYDETADPENGCVLNLLGLKITTQFHEQYNYYAELPAGLGNVEKDCRVCCSKPYVLHKQYIKGFIGHLPNNKLYDIIVKNKQFTDEIVSQAIKSVGGI